MATENTLTTDPLTPEQRARAEALHIAREVTKASTGLASVSPASAGDLVYIAEYILHGEVFEDGETGNPFEEVTEQVITTWEDVRDRIKARSMVSDDLLDAFLTSVRGQDGPGLSTSQAYDVAMDYLERVVAPMLPRDAS